MCCWWPGGGGRGTAEGQQRWEGRGQQGRGRGRQGRGRGQQGTRRGQRCRSGRGGSRTTGGSSSCSGHCSTLLRGFPQHSGSGQGGHGRCCCSGRRWILTGGGHTGGTGLTSTRRRGLQLCGAGQGWQPRAGLWQEPSVSWLRLPGFWQILGVSWQCPAGPGHVQPLWPQPGEGWLRSWSLPPFWWSILGQRWQNGGVTEGGEGFRGHPAPTWTEQQPGAPRDTSRNSLDTARDGHPKPPWTAPDRPSQEEIPPDSNLSLSCPSFSPPVRPPNPP